MPSLPGLQCNEEGLSAIALASAPAANTEGSRRRSVADRGCSLPTAAAACNKTCSRAHSPQRLRQPPSKRTHDGSVRGCGCSVQGRIVHIPTRLSVRAPHPPQSEPIIPDAAATNTSSAHVRRGTVVNVAILSSARLLDQYEIRMLTRTHK